MNIQQCRYVVAIAQEGSFSEAAKKLFVTQPSLSSSVKDLEDELGVSLFTRSKAGARLTEEGNDFLMYATKLLHQVALLEARYHTDYKKTFVVSTQHYDFLSKPFLTVIDQFADEYRNFHLIETSTQTILETVRDFRSELGILYLNETNQKIFERYFQQEDLRFEAIGEFSTQIFLRKNHPLTSKTTISQKDLESYPQVRFMQESSGPDFDEDPIQASQHHTTLYTNDRGTLMNLLCESNAYASGLGIISGFITEKIQLIPLKDSPIHTLGIVTSNKRVLSPIAQQFIQSIKESLSQSKS